MKIIDTSLSDVKIFEPQVFSDPRGFFYESFNQGVFESTIGRPVRFVQDNHSRSLKGVLRGLHYQLPPHPQGKLVRCVVGEVFDVALDIRASSPTFGKWAGVILSGENKRQLWIPEGFAHAFLVLSESAEFLYKTTDYWCKELERTIAWDDGDIGIEWPCLKGIVLSKEDMQGAAWAQAEVFE